MGTTGGVPAGWYPDPGGSRGQRWWDGNAWTEHVVLPTDEPAAPDVPAGETVGSSPAAGDETAAWPGPPAVDATAVLPSPTVAGAGTPPAAGTEWGPAAAGTPPPPWRPGPAPAEGEAGESAGFRAPGSGVRPRDDYRTQVSSPAGDPPPGGGGSPVPGPGAGFDKTVVAPPSGVPGWGGPGGGGSDETVVAPPSAAGVPAWGGRGAGGGSDETMIVPAGAGAPAGPPPWATGAAGAAGWAPQPAPGPSAPAGPPAGGGKGRGLLLVAAGIVVALVLASLGALAWVLLRPPGTVEVGAGTPASAAVVPTSGEVPTTAAPSTARRRSTTSAGGSRATEPDGVTFRAADGSFSLVVPEEWTPADADLPGAEAWDVGEPDDTASGRVEVTATQAPRGVSVETAVKSVRQELAKMGTGQVTVDDVEYLTSTSGQRIGRVTWTMTMRTSRVHRQAYVTVGSGRLVVMTVTAVPDESDEQFEAVEPYALTVRPGGTTA